MQFPARLISFAKSGRKAQVVTYLGESSARRSVTRHVELVTNHEGVGFHPDDSVPSQHSAAEKLVEELCKDRDTVVALFDTLKESVEKVKAKIKATKRNGKLLKGERILRVAAMQLLVETAERSIRNFEQHLKNLKEAISQAESRLREVQEKSPKNVT